MSKRGPRIDYPVRLPKSDRDLFVSPVAAVNGRLVRPGDLLVDAAAEKELEPILVRNDFKRYDPRQFNPENDFRQRKGAPDYGDLNAQLERLKAGVRLWSGSTLERTVDLVENQRVKGLAYNHVFVGEDFYHGGPGDAPAEVAGPDYLPSWKGDHTADMAVLDNGLPPGWQELHAELHPFVERFGVATIPEDPLDENGDAVLDKEAGHGLFICGLVARVAPTLDINLHRVLHASGEGDETKIGTTLLSLVGSSVKVINMSLGAYLPGDHAALLTDAIRQLKAEDKIVVASAGNAGGTPFGPGALFPARMPEVLAVGAYDSTTGKVWDKSCRGDVYAPGVDVLSAYVTWTGAIDWANAPGPHVFAGWARWSGTSFAAPLVAAELATLLAQPHPGSAQDAVDTWLASLCTEDWPNKSGATPTPRYDPTSTVTDWA
jgi:hypothetical protein